jgi:AcrR family transcriptional regulator
MNSAQSQSKTAVGATSDNSDVPERILDAAIRLYGEHGCDAVSARQIIKQAGVLNDAAIRYYFGAKQDLLRACVQKIASEIQPIMRQAFDELDARKVNPSKDPISPEHVITAVFKGFATLNFKNAAALKLMSRMMREEGTSGQKMQIEEIGMVLWRFEDELAAVLPNKSTKAIRLQAVLGITVMINALVDHELFSTFPAAAAGREEYAFEIEELAQGFIDFLTGGIGGPAKI